MPPLSSRTDRATAEPPSPVVDVVVPVHDEETDLEPCVRRLHAHLTASLPYPFRITVAENASTDGTVDVARRLAAELPEVRLLVLPEAGRGRALRTAWLRSEAPVLVYMDVDLSTDLAALLPLVAPLISGHSDLAVGTRLAPSSRVVRGAKREVISRGYNLLLRGALATRLSDAQCGFKAIRADVAARLLPLVEDTGWFFDTELLVLAERSGLRVHEVPVDWVDDPDSRVDIVATAKADLAGIVRMLRALGTGGLPVAELSTLAYLVLFLLLRGALAAQPANLVALLLTAMGNTAANRRVTFGIRGAPGAWRAQIQGLVVFLLGLALTSGTLAGLHAVAGTPARSTELLLLLGANALATGLRFLLFRSWVFRPRPVPVAPRATDPAVPALENVR